MKPANLPRLRRSSRRLFTQRRIHAWNLHFRYTFPWILLLLIALSLPWGQA